MLKHLEDKRVCPRCGHQLHEHDYLMARKAESDVWTANQIAWRIVIIAMCSIVLLAVHAAS